MRVCANPMCRDHVDMSIRPDAPYARVLDRQTLINTPCDPVTIDVGCHYREVKRYKYRNRYDDEVYMCGPCHSAIQMSRNLD